MRIPRFFHPDQLSVDTDVALSPDALHHCVNVLRLRVGANLILFDGTGKEFVGEIIQSEKRRVIVALNTEIALDPQSPLTLHLAQGVSKGDRMEWVLQKATELGVTDITPVITERCNVKLDESRWQKKHEQWKKVVIGACEQSGRNTLPVLHPVTALTDFLAQSTTQNRLILTPDAEQTFNNLQTTARDGFRLIIGPEGGLSDLETNQAREKGYQPMRFGPRILRTETAAIASIATLQSRFGDLI
ncbi:16S rRNA (uracil(1498)-N(3))-methyltransferase [Alteromonas sediminis]|uniref:Ribosomal RNA small subunit methyltransferase E n=1 Tax=Alteromonas sediminis TaxID=2259342 RepID=A0A3N5ZA46_9ALTE|nr:16S rRNA (uracil(1498)-N(3))-methyltransferase [Alteromonas sediminis]RPJ67924.1 16S rRNA (uracil(1498)-N(3))-methyltransferase [Alteromonas sediminis]